MGARLLYENIGLRKSAALPGPDRYSTLDLSPVKKSNLKDYTYSYNSK